MKRTGLPFGAAGPGEFAKDLGYGSKLPHVRPSGTASARDPAPTAPSETGRSVPVVHLAADFRVHGSDQADVLPRYLPAPVVSNTNRCCMIRRYAALVSL